MNKNNNTAGIVGLLLLIQFAIGILINQFLAGPFTFAPDYLISVAAHAPQVIASMLLGLLNEVISISVAMLLFPVFKRQHGLLAIAFLVFSSVSLMAVAADNANVQAMLALSKAYTKAGAPDAGYFETAGTVAYANRLWTHLMTFLISCLPSAVFYYLLFTSRLVPRFIAVWGFIGVLCMLIAVLLEIFNKGSFMLLYLPIGLNQLFLAIWLMVKRFNKGAIVAYEKSPN